MNPPWRALERASVLLAALAAGYLIHRACVLQVEYWDGFAYLSSASRLLGDTVGDFDSIRPPGVALLHLLPVALAKRGAPANAWLLRGPHLWATLASLGCAAAVYALLRRAWARPWAITGVALVLTSRLFLHYAPHVMSDVLIVGWAAACVALYDIARERRQLRWYVVCGVLLALGVLTKYTLAVLGPVLALWELAAQARERRVQWDRFYGLVLAGATSIVTFLAIQLAVALRVSEGPALAFVVAGLQAGRQTVQDAIPGLTEAPWDYVSMLAYVLPIPVLVLGVLGIGAACRRPTDADLPFGAWLVALGAGLVVMVRHTEARYLLPLLPPLVHFALRGARSLVDLLHVSPPAGGWRSRVTPVAVVLVLLVPAAGAGALQAVADQDPVFRTDVERRAAAEMLRLRRAPGRLVWAGGWHNLHAREATPWPVDEFFSVFHFAPQAVEYLTGERVGTLALPAGRAPESLALLALALHDGDALLRTDDSMEMAADLPHSPFRPVEIASVERHILTRKDAAGVYLDEAGEERLEARMLAAEGSGAFRIHSKTLSGAWTVFALSSGQTLPDVLGTAELAPGADVRVARPGDPAPRQLILLRLGWEQLPPP